MSQPAERPVTALDVVSLALLTAMWGGSFLFMRIAAPSFGPWATAWTRVTLAALCLLPWLWRRGELSALRRHWAPLLGAGLANSALPFAAMSFAMLTLSAGMAAVLNATAPLFGALAAWAWLGHRLDRGRVLGLLVGLAGVAWLVADRLTVPTEDTAALALAVGALLTATLLYGYGASFIQRYCAGLSPAAIATGSQVSSAVVLALPAAWHVPPQMPPLDAWVSVIVLAVFSTALAYLLYFRLIARMGPARAMAVTYLIPAFGMAWGWWWLDEPVTATMLCACAVILAGTALATGTVRLRTRQ